MITPRSIKLGLLKYRIAQKYFLSGQTEDQNQQDDRLTHVHLKIAVDAVSD